MDASPYEPAQPSRLRILLDLIDDGAYTTARRTLSRIADTLGYAIAHEWRTKGNVAAWANIKSVIPERPNGEKRHHPMLLWKEAPAAIAALRVSESMSALCLEFVILTMVRMSEARLARWGEFDFAIAIWTVPAIRMKKKDRGPFEVPLFDRALAILDEIRQHRRPGPYVFLGADRQPLSRTALWAQCHRLTEGKGSTHGWRATFRSWYADNCDDPEVAEACLAHAPGDATTQAYHRTPMLARRTPVYQRWADFLDGKEAAADNVVPLKAGLTR
jgi:integrase